MFAKQEQQIKEISGHEKTLIGLMEKLSLSCFDNEDRQIVQEKLTKVQDLKKQLETNLAKNREIYKNQVQGVEKNLMERENHLQQVDKAFQEFPDLLLFFTSKQKNLKESLVVITTQLQQT